MINLRELQAWFITGSQHLYGEKTLAQVAEHSQTIVGALSQSPRIPVGIVFRPVATTPEAILGLCREANNDPNCIGLIAWMHTFSPAKMWIAGLAALEKPFLHLHTQFNRDIPWATIDMDFMNLNQSAHGDREFGFLGSRMRRNRKVVVGHWQENGVQERIGAWTRAASAWRDSHRLKVARFGDNMRQVAVTEGDKIEAQLVFGYSVDGFGVGELVGQVEKVTDAEIDRIAAEYDAAYAVAAPLRKGGAQRQALRDAARIEAGLTRFLEEGGYHAVTDTFEDLRGLSQLPGVVIQRLMAAGYGFAAEGDWKTAALVRAMKVMGAGLPGGTSFMEDYTYHLDPRGPKVLGAHMLEICASIAAGKPALEVHPLSIGGKADPVRLVFEAAPGPALNASVIDLGDRFRMIVNEVDVVPPDEPLPRLPVARAVWVPRPDLATAAAGWILAGGAHHTGFSQSVTAEMMEDFAEMADVEFLLLNSDTRLADFKKELRWNDAFYRLGGAGRG
jgi:L-arabinose isomerase